MRVLVLGASPKSDRYSYKAVTRLVENNHEVVAVGNRESNIGDISIKKDMSTGDINTVTLYLSAKNQEQFEQSILALKPKRIIFNPGAENAKLYVAAENQGIEVLNACTLVMLSAGLF